MECCWIKVCPIRPNERMNLWIESNLLEQGSVAQRPIKLAPQNRQKINNLLRSVIEVDAQCVRRDDFEMLDAADQMLHKTPF